MQHIPPLWFTSLSALPTSRFIHVCTGALVVLMIGCAAPDNARNDMARQKAHTIAAQKYGSQFDLTANSTHEYFLCIKQQKERVAVQPVQFFIYSPMKDSIVYEREIDNGSVRWLNESQLSIERIPGNITGDEGPFAFTEIYDVVSGTISISKPDSR